MGYENASINEITNNVVDTRVNGGGQFGETISINLEQGNSGNIDIFNNVLAPGSDYIIYNYNPLATLSVYFNMAHTPFVTQNVAYQGSNTVGNFSINPNSYTVTGANVNAGSPEVEFTDLDLTRNDAGNGGGSNSWSNYWPVDGGARAQINYLNVPRRITTGSTLNVTGSGFSK